MRIRLVFHRSAVLELQDLANLLANLSLKTTVRSPDRKSVSLRTSADDDANNLRLLPELSNACEHQLFPEARQVGAVALQAQRPATSVAEALPSWAHFIAEKMIVAVVVQLGGSLQVRIVTVMQDRNTR